MSNIAGAIFWPCFSFKLSINQPGENTEGCSLAKLKATCKTSGTFEQNKKSA